MDWQLRWMRNSPERRIPGGGAMEVSSGRGESAPRRGFGRCATRMAVVRDSLCSESRAEPLLRRQSRHREEAPLLSLDPRSLSPLSLELEHTTPIPHARVAWRFPPELDPLVASCNHSQPTWTRACSGSTTRSHTHCGPTLGIVARNGWRRQWCMEIVGEA